MTTSSSRLHGYRLVAVLLFGFTVLLAVGGLAIKTVGLQDTPTASVNGKNIVGKTGS